MAPPVYTETFFTATVAAGGAFDWPVPAGFRAIVHDISGQVNNSGGLVGEVFVSGGGALFLHRKYPPYTNRNLHSRGQWTANADDTIDVTFLAETVPGIDCIITVTGALLSLP